jgi:hypothetical protein
MQLVVRTVVLSLLSGAAAGQCLETEVIGSDTRPNDQFGQDLAIWGDYAVSGAHFHDGVGLNSGGAYVFERTGGVWSEAAALTASDETGNDRYGFSADISGEIAVVGARYNDDAGYGSGSAYVYERGTGSWSETAKLVADVENANDFFGNSLAVSRGTVVVGAPGYSVPAMSAGAVYIFRKVSGSWTQLAILTAQDADVSDNFGGRVAIDSGLLVVGAKGDDDNGSQAGAAYVFQGAGSSWTQVAKLLPSDGAEGDLFGSAVAIHNGTVVVGALLDDDLGFDSGSAYVFEKVGGAWTQTAKLVPSDGATIDYFGASVAVDGDNILVGAWGAEAGGIDLGRAYKFQRLGSEWIETSTLTGPATDPGTNFGWNVDLSGDTALVAARGDIRGGAAYLYTDMETVPLYGTSCPGTAGLSPTLSMSGCPAPGGSASIDVRRGLGGSMAFLFLGLAAANDPLPGGCSLLLSPAPKYFPLPLSAGGPGAGAVSLPVTIPTDLPSASLYMQAFLVDGGAPNGFTVTNGLELIIP